mgnify:CR=1 FL=1
MAKYAYIEGFLIATIAFTIFYCGYYFSFGTL